MRRILLVIILLVALAVPATAQVVNIKTIPPGTRVGTKMVLIISVGKQKVRASTELQLAVKVRTLAKGIRTMDGVRSVDAVWFAEWKDGAGQTTPPWTPYGVVVVLESRDPDRLWGIANAVYARAGQVDQEMIRLNAVDDW